MRDLKGGAVVPRDRKAFFAELRQGLFRGRLSQSQVDGLNHLIDTWQLEHRGHDPRWLAYCLATAFHETAHAMRPLRELGLGQRKRYGQRDHNTGHVYYGRGYVQLTWATNYRRAGTKLGLPLYRQPELALQPDISARILFSGCLEGWFTGRKLADYINRKRCDYVEARHVVNGTDRADLIAAYARDFESALFAQGNAGRQSAEPIITGKPMLQSKTNWGAIITMITGTATAVAAAIRDVADSIGPFGLAILAIAGISAALFIVRERRLKAELEGI